MSPMLGSSQGVVLATAMAAAGTFLLFALRSNKSSLFHSNSLPALRPCLSSRDKKGERKKKKRVRFAKDVVEPTSNGELFRRRLHGGCHGGATSQRLSMPANRVALYRGLLRDRVVHRVAYMY